MIGICDYIYKNYPSIKDKFKYWQVLSFLDRNQDNVVCVKEQDKITGVGIYLKVNDVILERIKYRVLDITVPNDIAVCLKNSGNNVHFVLAVADSMKAIRQAVRIVKARENPQTISWFNKDMSDFMYFDFKAKEIKNATSTYSSVSKRGN